MFERGLPADQLAERFCLGSVLVSQEAFEKISSLSVDDFSTEKYRRIFARMVEMAAAEMPIDRLTLADALRTAGQLDSIGGYSELVALDEGMPLIDNLDGWVRIVREKAALRRMIMVSQAVMDGALLQHSSQELTEQLRQNLEEVERTGQAQDDGGSTPLEIAEGFLGGLSAFLDPTLRPKGLPTGFTKFDNMTSGMHAKEVVIFAARPSMGKTSLALNVAAHLALTHNLRKNIAFFSLEMSKASILNRLMCAQARVDAHKWRMGLLNAAERERLRIALDDVAGSTLRIYDQCNTMPEITKRIRRLAKEESLHLAVIDYLQLIGSHGRVENRNQEVSIISRQFKMLAGELDIPLVVLSQLSRANEQRRGNMRPMLSDLRDSGSIEQDADVVAFIFREEMYRKDREDLKGLAELIVAKQRNGPTGTIPLSFLGQFIRFENRAYDRDTD